MADNPDPLDDPIPPGGPAGRNPFAAPRFARFVASPATRRLAPRRLILAGSVALALAWAACTLGARCVDALAGWVAAQPEHQIPFDSIRLEPESPVYIRHGTPAILEAVRAEAKYGPTLSVLGTDLEELRKALSRNDWIEHAGPVRASHRRIEARVAYRKPLALMVEDHFPQPPGHENQANLVDRQGVAMRVELPRKGANMPPEPAFNFAQREPQHRLEGDRFPLIAIWGFGPVAPNRMGLIWKPVDPRVPEAQVAEAIRLAGFLADRAGSKTPGGRDYPTFVELHRSPEPQPAGRDRGFFLRAQSRPWVYWGSGPGAEGPTEPTAAAKWAMLGRYLDEHGSIDPPGAPGSFLRFLPTGAAMFDPTPTKAQAPTRPQSPARRG